MKTSNGKIAALLELLDDPNPEIVEKVWDELSNEGETVLPFLEEVMHNQKTSIEVIELIEELSNNIIWKTVRNGIVNWTASSNKSLIDGLYWINKLQYPSLDLATMHSLFSDLKIEFWKNTDLKATAFEQIHTFNTLFYNTFRFSTLNKQSSSPHSLLIPSVLEERQGAPISIGMIYSIIAQEINIPIYGVRFPINGFILAYLDTKNINSFLGDLNENVFSGVLFYISVHQKGRIMTSKHLTNYLKTINQTENQCYFEPASNTDILKEYLTQLTISCLEKPAYAQKVNYFNELLTILSSEK